MRFFSSLALMSLALAAVVTMSSCEKEDTTGDLTVIVRNEVGTLMTGKTVYLYNTQADFNNLTFSNSAVTNANGEAKFFSLAPQTYWFDCDFDFLGIIYSASGSSTVNAGMVTTTTIQP